MAYYLLVAFCITASFVGIRGIPCLSDSAACAFAHVDTALSPPKQRRSADDGGGCSDPPLKVPDMVLIGFARAVTDAKSFDDCYQKCITVSTWAADWNEVPTAKSHCNSGMFFKDVPSNCVLNLETKSSHPDQFTPQAESGVTYFEPNCK